MRISRQINEEFLAELMHACDDAEQEDFEPTEYATALFKAQRKIAKTYHVLDYTIEMELDAIDTKGEIPLPQGNISEIVSLRVNGELYHNVREITQDNEYVIRHTAEEYTIRYNNPMEGDKLNIEVTLLGPASAEFPGIPTLPEKYWDEIQREALVILSKWGLVKFSHPAEEPKKVKYSTLLNLSRKNSIDSELFPETKKKSIKLWTGPIHG